MARVTAGVAVLLCLLWPFGAAPSGQQAPAVTTVTISGEDFHINGQPTLKGRVWRGHRVEGLLPNARMVQGIFDDRNPETRARWAYPDTRTWDPDRNTREFIAGMREWRRRGLLAFTLNLQGGSPEGYSKAQPWHNSAFDADGSLRPDYTARLTRILDEADRLGMAVILGLFYFGQDDRLRDEAAVIRAVDTAVTWILTRGYRNVLVEINNECNINYDHAILKPARVAELIQRVKRTAIGGRRLLASTSFGGNTVPDAAVVQASDFILLHGNGVGDPNRIAQMVAETRKTAGYTPKPIVFNEDDHFDFDKPLNNFVAATSARASWGFFDFRKPGEGFDEGYQSVPVNWGVSSSRKTGFFSLTEDMSREPSAPAGPALDPRSLTADLPFEMPAVALPRIPQRTCRITDHGARGDGLVLNTQAIAAAIGACAEAGGGRVVVPRGVFLTGPIELKSRIDLHLERGALLLFSPVFEHYPLVRTSYEGGDAVKARSPIWANGAEDIAITGEGTVDGSGQAWRPVKKFKMTPPQWQALLASGGAVDQAGSTWWPSLEALNGAATIKALDARGTAAPIAEYAAAREYLRPVMISLVESRRVLLDGPTFQNSPAWNIHPLLCEDVVIRNITVLNPWYSQNGDGLDLESCRRVIVHNCRFDVGDDAICIKSGKDAYGRRRGRPTEQIVVTDNIVYHGHGGFTVGSEMSGGVRNILVERCTFLGTDVGLRFKTTRGRGGVVEKIWIRDVQMKDIPTDAIGFNMYYGGDAPTETAQAAADVPRPAMPVGDGTPQFRDIVLSRILCRGADRAVMLEGLPEMPIRGIVLDDVRISARRGLAMVDAEGIVLRRLDITPATGPVVSVRDGRNVTVEGGSAAPGTGVFLRVDGASSSGIRLSGVRLEGAKTAVETGPAVKPDAVVRQ